MSAQIIRLPLRRPATPDAGRQASYDWLKHEAETWVRRQGAAESVRQPLAEATPAQAPETAEILAALRRIEKRLAGKMQ